MNNSFISYRAYLLALINIWNNNSLQNNIHNVQLHKFGCNKKKIENFTTGNSATPEHRSPIYSSNKTLQLLDSNDVEQLRSLISEGADCRPLCGTAGR